MLNLQKWSALGFTLCAVCVCVPLRAADTTATAPTDQSGLKLETSAPKLWDAGVGEGFRSSAHSLTFEAGAAQGFAILGTHQAHDLALVSLSYGHMLGNTVGEGHFYRGNWEWRAELFGGVQFSPDSDWVIGLAPHLRYNFATGSRFVPFIDGGAGVTATSIGPPDLSNIFEFNLQASVGVQVFVRDDLAVTIEARYLHLSCAGISNPNLGLNSVVGLAGLTLFF